jgi:hypothetical protein
VKFSNFETDYEMTYKKWRKKDKFGTFANAEGKYKDRSQIEKEIKNVLHCLLCQGIMFNPVLTVARYRSLLSFTLPFIKVGLKRMHQRMVFLLSCPSHPYVMPLIHHNK